MQQQANFVRFSDPNLFAELFPHLFPFGYGHPGTERKLNVSLEEFAQDDTFLLIAFDIVTRKTAMSKAALMCKLNPGNISTCDSVTASELSEQLEYDPKRASSLQKGQIFQEKTRGSSTKLLFPKVEATLGNAFATNEERKYYQRRAWNMPAKYHSAEMFITVTPSETGNATVAYVSGDISENP